MTGPLLVIIAPDVHTPDPQGTERVRADWPGPCEVLRPALESGDVARLHAVERATGVVITGSAASVHDDLPWLDALARALRPVIDHGEAAILGICFGHQLIAHLTGGVVAYLDDAHERELGVRLTHSSGSLLIPDGWLEVIASHHEIVTTLPERFQVTGTRERVAVDAFQDHAGRVFGVQYHPEARSAFVSAQGLDPAEVITARVERDGDRVLSGFRARALALASAARSQ